MSNILIIKHGSLGDLIQANGAIEDIKKSYQNSKVLLLTTSHYGFFMSHCPYLDGVLIDKRLPRWNLFYLYKLKKLLERYNFKYVFDLQNSSRTRFYRRFLLPNLTWSSTDTTLEKGQEKKMFDKDPVLERLEIQLTKSGIKTSNVNKINLSWAFTNIETILKDIPPKEFILLFPFCSKKHVKKKWPYFKEMILFLNRIYKEKYTILIAPGPKEIEESKKFGTRIVLDRNRSLNLNQLITLINKAAFVISNDTGPAHICTHLNKKGLVLFGSHTSPEKVSIESENFKSITARNLSELKIQTVVDEVKKYLN